MEQNGNNVMDYTRKDATVESVAQKNMKERMERLGMLGEGPKNGVLLGEDLDGIFVAHTFITYEMANGLQRAEFEKNREKVLSNREAYEKIREIYGY